MPRVRDEAPVRPVIHVVDGDADTRARLCGLLSQLDAEVRTYRSAEDFLAGGARRGDCLLTEAELPGMGGVELIALLRSRGIPYPVIVLSGGGDVATAVRAMQVGAAEFLSKPFAERIVLEQVRAALEFAADG